MSKYEPVIHYLNVGEFSEILAGRRKGIYTAYAREISSEDLSKKGFSYLTGIKSDKKDLLFLEFSNIHVSEPTESAKINLKFVSTDYNYAGFFFRNCILPDMEMESVSGDLFFYGCRLGVITVGKGSGVGNLWFRQKTEADGIQLMHGAKCKDLAVLDNSNCRNIWVYNRSVCGAVRVQNESRSGDIDVNLNSIVEQIDIIDLSICEEVKLEYGCYNEIIFIKNKCSCKGIKVSKSQCSGIWTEGSIVKNINAEGCCFSLYFYNSQIALAKIVNSCINRLTWRAGTKGEIYLDSSNINYLDLSTASIPNNTIFSITNSRMSIIRLENNVVQGLLLLRGVKSQPAFFVWPEGIKNSDLPENIYQDKVDFHEKLKQVYEKDIQILSEEFPQVPVLIIVKSSLGKTEITGSDFHDFDFCYEDSRIFDIFINDTRLPEGEMKKCSFVSKDMRRIVGYKYKNVQVCQLDNSTSLSLLEQKVSFYSQLRKVFTATGNHVQASKYFSLSLNNQQKLFELIRKNEKNVQRNKKRGWSDRDFDIFNFKLNKVSSLHGESWRKALVFTFACSLISYILYFISLNYYKPFNFSSPSVGYAIGNYFSFLDISHKIDFMVTDRNDLNLGARFFDFAGKVVIGYGIYQLITAFRRHGKQ